MDIFVFENGLELAAVRGEPRSYHYKLSPENRYNFVKIESKDGYFSHI